MNSYQSGGMTKQNWVLSNPSNIIDYNHQRASSASQAHPTTSAWKTQNQTSTQASNPRHQRASASQTHPTTPTWKTQNQTSTQASNPRQQLYNPFVQDEDMNISDDERYLQHSKKSTLSTNVKHPVVPKVQPTLLRRTLEIKSGAAFYQGLILYIPSFEQITNTYRGSPAMKMLYASFEFSFKLPIKIEVKQQQQNNEQSEALVVFKNHLIAKTTNTAIAAYNEVCVRALELLSETCYTIQAKENYYKKCKIIDGSEMKTLNLMKWEAVSQKYPKIAEISNNSHIQKTFAVFLDNHTSNGVYEDIICCNLTREDVINVKSVVEFFELTLLPCCINTNLAKKNTPCVISIQKFTSAKKLLEMLVENGGENDKFKLYPPDSFKDFYKLHHNYWGQKTGPNQVLLLKTTLEDVELQSAILKPYGNVVAELFEKHKLLPKLKKQNEDSEVRQAGDNFMKDTLKIDMAHSKTVAPVDRMQLLLKYMEQLQEYGSRVLASGRPEMIKIYHHAIDNLRKDLDVCRKDIEKEQKDKKAEKEGSKSQTRQRKKSRSPISRKKIPPKVRSKSPGRRSYKVYSKRRSVSPKKRSRSRTPKKAEKRRSASPRRRPRSRSPRKSGRQKDSPHRRNRSPPRKMSPVRRPRSRSPHVQRHHEENILETIFKDQFKRFVEMLRRFRSEIEDTPIERRGNLRDSMMKHQEQLHKFYTDAMNNRKELGCCLREIEICQDEIDEQVQLIAGKPGPNDLPRNLTPPPWMNDPKLKALIEGIPATQYNSYSMPGRPVLSGGGGPAKFGAGVPTTFGAGVPAKFGAGVPATFGAGVPATFGAGVPATFGAGVPATFGAGVPAMFRAGVPATFGAGVPAQPPNTSFGPRGAQPAPNMFLTTYPISLPPKYRIN